MAKFRSTKINPGKFETTLEKIETAVKDNFIQTKTCIDASDANCAMQLLKKYEWVGKVCDQSLKDLISEKDKKLSLGDSATLALYFRWLKRINAHLRNITTSIVNPFDRIGFTPKK